MFKSPLLKSFVRNSSCMKIFYINTSWLEQGRLYYQPGQTYYSVFWSAKMTKSPTPRRWRNLNWIEWSSVNDTSTVLIGRIEKVEDEKISIIDKLPYKYYNYMYLFRSWTIERLASHQTFDNVIDLTPDTQPSCGPIYPFSEKQLKALQEYLAKMLIEGKILPSKSPAGTPILLIPKPDGKFWLDVDYRGLTKVMIYNKYPVALMSELRNQVHDATIVTKLDQKVGFYLIISQKGDKWKTTFRTRHGSYE